MALGGYKFAGRKVTKPEGATDVQWVLLCHKCRVKAFLESNALSGAGWAFDPDQSSGQISFETYGNVIYRLDDLGYNLVSFFKHGDGDAYFAICTFTYYAATADLANGRIALTLPEITSSYQYGRGCVMFCNISKTPMNTETCKTSGVGRIGCFPCGRPVEKGTNYYPTPSNWAATNYMVYVGYNSFSAGFAIKDKNIITFVNVGYWSGLYANIAIFSVGGFSKLCNDNDDYNIFAFNPQYQSQATSVQETENTYLASLTSPVSLFTSNSLFTLSDTGSARRTNYLRNYFFSMFTGSIQYYPFESIAVIQNAANSLYLNMAKGIIGIDLIAISTSMESSATPRRKTTAANGNYLAVTAGKLITSGNWGNLNSSASISLYPSAYIGWDPSNPDITQESAWTAYTE